MLEIFYPEFIRSDLEEKPSDNPIGVISDLGGLTGVWVGISALKVIEMVYHFFFLVLKSSRQFMPDGVESIKDAQNGHEKMSVLQ